MFVPVFKWCESFVMSMPIMLLGEFPRGPCCSVYCFRTPEGFTTSFLTVDGRCCVMDGSRGPVEVAGVSKGDIIVSVDGNTPESHDRFMVRV